MIGWGPELTPHNTLALSLYHFNSANELCQSHEEYLSFSLVFFFKEKLVGNLTVYVLIEKVKYRKEHNYNTQHPRMKNDTTRQQPMRWKRKNYAKAAIGRFDP